MDPSSSWRRLLLEDTPTIADDLRTEWSGPPDVLSILLLLGGDVVQASIAQLAGSHHFFTPTVFSFGWVSYALSALLSAVGENRLMPRSPDYPCVVINGKSGYGRDNRSWMISRIARDFDHWKGKKVETAEQNLKDELKKKLHPEDEADRDADPRVPLSVSIYNILEVLKEKLRAKGKADRDTDPRVPLSVSIYNILEVLKEKLRTKGKADRDADPRVPLSVSIYNISGTKQAGTGDNDVIYYFSFLVIVVQFALAAIPCGLYNDWSVLMVTGAGSLLAWYTAALPQWQEEKIGACRKKSRKTFIITSGNGSKDVIVIRGREHGLDLEDLAAASARTASLTRIALFIFAVLWIGLLITVAGLKLDTWYLLGVGGVGTVQNILVAALPRRPGAYGIHLDYDQTICEEKVMSTLQAVEDIEPLLGRSLLSTFFPGEMRQDEIKWWDAKNRQRSSRESTHVESTHVESTHVIHRLTPLALHV